MTTTNIETRINRTLAVTNWGNGQDCDLRVTNTKTHESVFSVLDGEQATKLGLALLGENATPITDLPEAEVSENGLYVAAGDVQRRIEYYTAESFLEVAKNYLALHAFMVKREAEQEAEQEAANKAEEEAVKAKEASNAKRRAELCKEFGSVEYASLSYVSKQAFDRIIELEAATV